jgi:hypothetical protein
VQRLAKDSNDAMLPGAVRAGRREDVSRNLNSRGIGQRDVVDCSPGYDTFAADFEDRVLATYEEGSAGGFLPTPGLQRACASLPRWARSRRSSWRSSSYHALVPCSRDYVQGVFSEVRLIFGP